MPKTSKKTTTKKFPTTRQLCTHLSPSPSLCHEIVWAAITVTSLVSNSKQAEQLSKCRKFLHTPPSQSLSTLHSPLSRLTLTLSSHKQQPQWQPILHFPILGLVYARRGFHLGNFFLPSRRSRRTPEASFQSPSRPSAIVRTIFNNV